MTGVIEAPGIGHNQPDPLEMEKKNQKWERWAKKRTFVRALEGTYSHLYKTLKEEKRVYSAGDVATFDGKLKLIATGTGEVTIAVNYAKTFIDPTAGAFPGHSSELIK